MCEATVEMRGLQYDRRWMVVDPGGEAITQRTCPKLALVQVRVVDEGLVLAGRGMPDLRVRVPGANTVEWPTIIWDAIVLSQTAEPEANEWFTEYLGRPCQLVYMPDGSERRIDPTFGKGIVAFSDGYPLHLTSAASLDDLNSRMSEAIPMTRFRPNVVIEGGKAYEEDAWRRIRIGDVYFKVVKPCSRCKVTTVDQDTTVRSKEPLRTMARFRKRGSKVYFGQNLIPERLGIIRVGDSVEILGSVGQEEVWAFTGEPVAD